MYQYFLEEFINNSKVIPSVIPSGQCCGMENIIKYRNIKLYIYFNYYKKYLLFWINEKIKNIINVYSIQSIQKRKVFKFIKLFYILDNKLLKMKLHRYLKANPLKLALLAHRGLFQKQKKNWVIATNSDCVILILLQPQWCEIKQSKFEIPKVLPYGCKRV